MWLCGWELASLSEGSGLYSWLCQKCPMFCLPVCSKMYFKNYWQLWKRALVLGCCIFGTLWLIDLNFLPPSLPMSLTWTTSFHPDLICVCVDVDFIEDSQIRFEHKFSCQLNYGERLLCLCKELIFTRFKYSSCVVKWWCTQEKVNSLYLHTPTHLHMYKHITSRSKRAYQMVAG